MKSLELSRYAVTIGAVTALLAGCVGPQPPISAPGAMPQTRTIAEHSHSDGSWGYGKKDLLYVSDQNGSDVNVFTYPKGKFVGTLTGFTGAEGLCSDTLGNVWITTAEGTYGTGTLVEFAHGGTTPVATLADPYGRPDACASDPNTGNLAVANGCADYSCGGGNGNVVVYAGGSGPPAKMLTPVWGTYDITYDSAGNIFVAGYENYEDSRLAWLPNGSSSFQDFNLKPRNIAARGVEWDGAYLLIGQGPHFHQFKLVDGYGVRVSMVPPYIDERAYLVLGNRLITAGGSGVLIYKYPTGTSPIKTISVPGSNIVGLTISLAQTH